MPFWHSDSHCYLIPGVHGAIVAIIASAALSGGRIIFWTPFASQAHAAKLFRITDGC